MRCLLVEDDERTALFIIKGLRQAGFVVEHAADGDTGLSLALSEDFDIAVVDVMLPGIDGLTLIERMRRRNIQFPIIVLSAKGSVDDRVTGLQRGGDDYMTKPFAFSELLARIHAHLRRASSAGGDTTVLTVGDLSLDLIRRKAYRAGNSIELKPLEFSLLEYLMRNAGHVLSKTMIIEHVWDYNFDPQTNVVETGICRLRD
ncbi:MAG: response regulator transcription factor, partial [Desulfomonilia bacterium]